jgi:hypothetical protein
LWISPYPHKYTFTWINGGAGQAGNVVEKLKAKTAKEFSAG